MNVSLTGERWYAPFTCEQVIVLNAWQAPGVTICHPYTCGNDSRHPALVATRSTYGWVCEACDYTQNWAHVTNDPFELIGLTSDALIQAIIEREWYVQPNDMIGGTSIMPVPLPPSSGYPAVADVLDENIARHIAHQHNQVLRYKKEFTDRPFQLIKPSPRYVSPPYYADWP